MTFTRSIKKRLLRVEIWLGLAWARFLIKFVPFHRWRTTLGKIDGEPDAMVWPEFTAAQLKMAGDVGRKVDQVADRLRVFKAVCLPRAMTARWVLARRGVASRIIIGSRRGKPEQDEDDLLFHAWLMVGDRIVTGANEREAFLAFSKRRGAASEA